MRVQIINVYVTPQISIDPSREAAVLLARGSTSIGFKIDGAEALAPDAAERMLARFAREGGDSAEAARATVAGSPATCAALEAGFKRAGCAAVSSRALEAPAPFRWNAEPRSPAPSAGGARVRAMIVDDSDPIRKLLETVLGADPSIEIVGSFGLPSQAEEAFARLKPDVVTLDIHMPEMNGVELLKRLQARGAARAVMISSLSKEEGGLVLDAIEAGAVDYMQKPSLADLDVAAPVMREKVRAAAAAHVQAPSRARAAAPRQVTVAPAAGFAAGSLIAIGSSTGGTEALKQVLTMWPAEVPPILIVQHIPAVFSRAFADRMNALCAFEVREAKDGDLVSPSLALVAPGGFQMRVLPDRNGALRVRIEDSEPVNRHKPSVDALFDSIAALKGPRVAAAILTGMGADGARGLLRLRETGARTVAQDEATCVVYGMPREAAKIGAAEKIAPLGDIADALLGFCARAGRGAA